MMYKAIEEHCAAIIEGRKPAGILKPLLRLASLGYRAGLSLQYLFQKIWKSHPEAVEAIVISVGNIAVGGTGKTPVVQALARMFAASIPTAILTRGYRSHIERKSSSLRLRWDKGLRSNAKTAGDEAILLAESVANCDVWVGPDRVSNARSAVAQGARLLILDDGMQYTALQKDFEIAVVDSIDPLGRGLFLPEGPLRALPRSLGKVDIVIAQRADTKEKTDAVERMLRTYTDAPIVGGRTVPQKGAWVGQKVGVACAIGNPQRFLEMLKREGCEIVDALLLRDHSEFEEENLREFAQKCHEKGASFVLCTEKDSVKIPDSWKLPISLCTVPIEWEPAVHSDRWNNFIHNIKSKIEEIDERRI